MTNTLQSSYSHHSCRKYAIPCNIIKSTCFASITAKQNAKQITLPEIFVQSLQMTAVMKQIAWAPANLQVNDKILEWLIF